jgi:hypothetical protein
LSEKSSTPIHLEVTCLTAALRSELEFLLERRKRRISFVNTVYLSKVNFIDNGKRGSVYLRSSDDPDPLLLAHESPRYLEGGFDRGREVNSFRH